LYRPLLNAAACGGVYLLTADRKVDESYYGCKKIAVEGVNIEVYFNGEDHDSLAILMSANYRIACGKGEEKVRWGEDRDKTYKQVAQERAAALKPNLSVQEIAKKIRTARGDLTAYEKEWETLYAKLKEVQQLFIAV